MIISPDVKTVVDYYDFQKSVKCDDHDDDDQSCERKKKIRPPLLFSIVSARLKCTVCLYKCCQPCLQRASLRNGV